MSLLATGYGYGMLSALPLSPQPRIAAGAWTRKSGAVETKRSRLGAFAEAIPTQ